MQAELFPQEFPKGLSHQEVSSWDIRKVVAEPEWQALRVSFLGTWKTHPKQNVVALRAYLAKDPSDAFRWRRVHNYLTGSAFRMGIIASPEIAKLLGEVRKERGIA